MSDVESLPENADGSGLAGLFRPDGVRPLAGATSTGSAPFHRQDEKSPASPPPPHSQTGSEDILGTAAGWRAAGETVALATVVETWGSSPRPAGSQLAVTESGRLAGSVSGGCIEGAVAEAAQRTMRTGAPQVLDFGISDERAWEVGLACGGKLTVFVEKLA